MFSESSTGSWAALQLSCCPSKQGKLSENILQNIQNKLPPQTVVQLTSKHTTLMNFNLREHKSGTTWIGILKCGTNTLISSSFQSSASECILDSLLAARAQMIQRLKSKYGDDVEETTLLSKMMAYCSKEAHSSVEKAAMIRDAIQ